jgi:hypothetical protein
MDAKNGGNLTRREALATFGALAAGAAGAQAMQGKAEAGAMQEKRKYEVAAYYFPNYHVDPRNEEQHGPGWTEWELVKRAEPRFPGHRQPRVPAWGYEDEADPAVMAKKIDAAADHAVDVFLYDWYWYDDKPFLQRCLEEGFQKAPNKDRLKFAIHWANHTWLDIMPAKLRQNSGPNALVQYKGPIARESFDKMTDYVIAKYFKDPSYWTINGCPYFSIYELTSFMEGLGGTEQAAQALADFRAKTKAAGFPDLHLNAMLWSVKVLPTEKVVQNPVELLKVLGFDSIGSYVWVHHVALEQFPETPYAEAMEKAIAHWNETVKKHSLPFHPNVSMGWDSSPRTVQSDKFINAGYPFTPTISGNTPRAFREGLAAVKNFLDAQSWDHKVVSLNAWNEWTEGSYLEPDTVNGLGYLEAIKAVFG